MAAPQAAASRVRTASSIAAGLLAVIAAQIERAAAATSQQAEVEGQRVRATRLLSMYSTNDGKIQPKIDRDDDDSDLASACVR